MANFFEVTSSVIFGGLVLTSYIIILGLVIPD